MIMIDFIEHIQAIRVVNQAYWNGHLTYVEWFRLYTWILDGTIPLESI